jgi:signal transduction histidine kinase
MNTASFDTALFFIYFIYGLAFFGLGMALAVESGRSPALADAKVIRPLAIFGLIHGIHEWFEAYLMQSEAYAVNLPVWLNWFRSILLIVSFVFLAIYVVETFRWHPYHLKLGGYLLISILGVYGVFILVNAAQAIHSGSVNWYDLLNVLPRYLLAVPAAILAAFALRHQAADSVGDERSHLLTHLSIAAIGFFFYGLAQIIVPKVNMVPAWYINTTSFRVVVGIPIQVVRAGMAMLITMGLVRATQLVERQRQRLAAVAQQAHLEALEQRDHLRHELLFHTVQTQEEERARIAREIHDETAQVLTAFSLNLATLRNYMSIVPETTPVIERLQVLSKQMSHGLYRLVHDLRPAQLDDLGLIPAIQYLKDSNAVEGLEVLMEVQGQQRRLDAIVETVLFRVIQEGLNNVLRHAQTRQAHVLVIFGSQEISIKIVDHGIGFDPQKFPNPPHGWGLVGMRERVELIRGKLRIDSGSGRGTSVEVIVPNSEAMLKRDL